MAFQFSTTVRNASLDAIETIEAQFNEALSGLPL